MENRSVEVMEASAR